MLDGVRFSFLKDDKLQLLEFAGVPGAPSAQVSDAAKALEAAVK